LPNSRLHRFNKEHLLDVLRIEDLSNPSPWSERSFIHEIDNRNGIFEVALIEGKVVGYAGIWLVVDEAHITTVAIDPAYRKQGIGETLICSLLEQAKEKNMACATLEVRASNEAAIHLYEKLGFVISATRRNYYPNDNESAFVMWLFHLETWQQPAAKDSANF